MIFCNISVITKYIDLKFEVFVHYPKSNPYYQGRQFKMLFFRIMNLFRFRRQYFPSHFSQQPCITATSNLVGCFSKGSYTLLTEFRCASNLLPFLTFCPLPIFYVTVFSATMHCPSVLNQYFPSHFSK